MSTTHFDGEPEVPVRRKVSDEDREREAANERERRKLIEERRLQTYHGHAQHTDEDIYSGRYASVNTTVVTGAAPGSAFPQMPDGPWAKNELPDEPLIDGTGEGDRLGYEIDRPDVVSAADQSTVAASAVEDTPALESRPAMSPVADNAGAVSRRFPRRF